MERRPNTFECGLQLVSDQQPVMSLASEEELDRAIAVLTLDGKTETALRPRREVQMERVARLQADIGALSGVQDAAPQQPGPIFLAVVVACQVISIMNPVLLVSSCRAFLRVV